MKQLIGIDEAGYGPRLGPLVTAVTRFHIPRAAAPEDLYQRLRPIVGRRGEAAATIAVDDSKRIYQSGGDLGRLERPIMAFLAAAPRGLPARFADLLDWTPVEARRRLASYPWYPQELVGRPLPLEPGSRDQNPSAALGEALTRAGIQFEGLYIHVTLAGEFNQAVQSSGNKATMHAAGIMRALDEVLDATGPTETEVIVDRLGGRTYYAPLLAATWPFAAVHIEREAAGRSVYRIDDPGRPIRISFVTKGDREYLPVALASMAAKYVRELFMDSLNAYFRARVRHLRPTAGYPSDAGRFLEQIADLLPQLDATCLIRQR